MVVAAAAQSLRLSTHPLHFSYLNYPTIPSSSSSPLFLHLLLPHLIKMFRMMRAGVVGVQKMHKVEEKARAYKCLDKKCLDKEGWKCHSTLIKHWKEDHGSGNSRSIYCHYCGNLKGYENSCAFLTAHQPPCAAKIELKITRAYALAILAKQGGEDKKKS